MPPLILNGTTGISGVDGSAGTPSYQGTDNNTGVFFPAADVIAFSTSGTEDARFDSAGNFGIGTSSPAIKLEVNGTGELLRLDGSANQNRQMYLRNVGTGTAKIYTDGTMTVGSNAAYPLTFITQDAERMRIDSSGNVRIGNTTGNGKLSVQDSSAALQEIFTNSGTNYAALEVKNTGSSVYIGKDNSTGTFFSSGSAYASCVWSGGAYPLTFSTNGSERMRIADTGRVGVATNSPDSSYTMTIQGIGADVSSQLYLKRQGSPQGLFISAGGGLAFYTSYEGNNVAEGQHIWQSQKGTTVTERMRIDASGNLLVGTTSTSGTSNGFYCPALFNFTSGSGANTVISSDGLFRRSTSSLKYKKDVQDATHGLAEVLQLRPVTYKGKAEFDGDKVFGGLIAEEVNAIGLTEFVQYAEDGSPDALSYGHMVSLLTKAIQEQQAMIEELTNRIKKLEGVK